MCQEAKGSIKKGLSKSMKSEDQNTIEVIDDAIKEMDEVGTLILEESDDSEKEENEESVRGEKEKTKRCYYSDDNEEKAFL